MYAVDGGSTESLAKVMQKLGLKGKVHAGGFDLTEQTQNLIKAGYLEFTIDQQPYLQGFVPALQMFFYKVSGTQTGPFEANTGLKFVTPETVEPVHDEVPLRGHDLVGRRRQILKQGRSFVASVAQDPASSSPGGPEGSAQPRRALWRDIGARLDRAARGQHHRHHGRSSRSTSRRTRASFFTKGNFETLLPYFAPLAILAAGEVFVMILGEIDLSIARDVPVRADHVLQAEQLARPAARAVADRRAAHLRRRSASSTASSSPCIGINSFVATLGTLFTFEGLSLIISQRDAGRDPGRADPGRHVREGVRRRAPTPS